MKFSKSERSHFLAWIAICRWLVAGAPTALYVADLAAQTVEERLSTLPANHAMVLGPPRIEGEFNDTARAFRLHRTGPTGRDYTLKMVWAPERGRALFAGANHGVPHRLNDVWEFDLPTLTWTMLYAPDNARSYGGLGDDPSDVEYKDGILVTRRGGPAIIGHTWWGITYDVPRRRLLYMNTWVSDQDQIIKRLGADPATRYKGPPLWAFEPEQKRWSMVKSERPWPRAPFASMLEYVPSIDSAIWHSNDWEQYATWLYDPKLNNWRDLKANAASGDFTKQSARPEQVAYVGPVRNLIVAHSERSTYHFDVARSQWRKVLEAPKDSTDVPFGHDARSVFYYDPVSGHGLLVELASVTVWAYDPATIKWQRLQPEGEALPKGPGHRRLAFIDPLRNVLVVTQTDAIWAYRYRAK